MATVHQLARLNVAASAPQGTARRVLIRAALRLRGSELTYPLTIRELSSTGLSAATPVSMFTGARVEVELPNIGWIPGEVITSEEGKIRVALGVVINAVQAEVRVTGSYASPLPCPPARLRRL